jgi:Mg2+/Co2+ transporter CorB
MFLLIYSFYIRLDIKKTLIVIYATSFCVDWAFLTARGTRLKHKSSEGRRTSLKLPNLLKMVSHLLLTVLTHLSRPVRNVTLNVLSRATVR